MAAVFDFDEEDIEPFPNKSAFKNRTYVSRPVKDAEQKSCSTACRKYQRKKSSKKNVDEKNSTKRSFQSLESVLKTSRCSSSHGNAQTQCFESSSKSEVIKEPVKFEGCCSEDLSASPHAKEEKLPEMTVGGEGLLFGGSTIQMHSLEFTFMTDSIALKLFSNENLTTIAWPLDEISGFSFRTSEQANDNILELNLTESGMKLLEQKLGSPLCKPDFSCDKGYTLTTKLKSPYQSDQERKVTSLCDCYKVLWRPGEIKKHEQTNLKQDLQQWKGAEKHNVLCKGESDEWVIGKGFEADVTAWFDLTYPKGDPDAVIVTKDDFLLLNPHEFVSDTIIDFYIKYLQSRLPEHEKERLYFFNSFFFRKLAHLDRDVVHDLGKTSSLFERMKRWTRDINIFTKDFLFFPIMQSAHWSLVIVCYPRHLFNDEHRKCYKETLILHFDSMEGFHRGVEEMIEKYLVQHWAHTFSTSTSRDGKSCNVTCIHAKVPQQTNYSDCGLYLLHYVEMFLRALESGLPTVRVSRDWFKPEDVASKRSMLQRLIKELQEEETAGKVVLTHLDTPFEEPMHDTVFKEDVSVVQKQDVSEELTDVVSTQQAECSCRSGLSQMVDHSSDACKEGAAIKTFNEDSSSEPSYIPLMENMHPTYSDTGKDERKLFYICGDVDVSGDGLNKMHEDSRLITNPNQAKNSEAQKMHVSFHTLETSSRLDEYDVRSHDLMYCDQSATEGKSSPCKVTQGSSLPCKDKQTLCQADEQGFSCGSDFEDYTFNVASSEATHLKKNLMDKMDHTRDEEQGHSATGRSPHPRSPTCQPQQVYISSDEESDLVKVQKIVEAAKLRQQSRQRKVGGSEGVTAPSADHTSKRKENLPQNAKWRLQRKSQFHFH